METDKQLTEISKTLLKIQTSLDRNTKVINKSNNTIDGIATWKPKIDAQVEDLKSSMESLRDKVDRMILQQDADRRTNKVLEYEDVDLTKLGAAHLAPPFPKAASGQFGRGDEHLHRRSGYAVVTTLTLPPVTRANQLTDLTPVPLTFGSVPHPGSATSFGAWGSAMPQLEFP
ncbi:hypothetical protein PAHAL_9G229600 [Panicum hallii]|jgi:hypothetical protein|uniref:Uncharacterized protein n=1 Tax=Panicum hallii TaxID=206008 RepID=A0A2T8I274_9POAL|nr:hypothetical protein PAHAL_9G229600 [Panicum hallii]